MCIGQLKHIKALNFDDCYLIDDIGLTYLYPLAQQLEVSNLLKTITRVSYRRFTICAHNE